MTTWTDLEAGGAVDSDDEITNDQLPSITADDIDVTTDTVRVYDASALEMTKATVTEFSKSVIQDALAYLPSGTGAVSMSVQAALRNFFTPDMYGAVGDGTTNDTAAVQACFTAATAAGTGVLLIKTYSVSTVTAAAGLTIVGMSRHDSGLTLRNSTNNNCLVISSNCTVENFRIEGNYANQNAGSGVRVADSATDFTIKGLEINNCRQRFIAVGAACARGLITGNVCNYTAEEGGIDVSAGASGTTDMTVSHNIVRRSTSGNIAATGQVNGFYVLGNHIEVNDPDNTGSHLGDNITAYNLNNTDILVVGNTCIDSANNGIHVGGDRVTVHGNNVYSPAQTGIAIAKSPNGAATAASVLSLTGNTIDSPGNHGIDVQNYSVFTVGSNSVTSAGAYGIIVQSSSTQGSITGNSVNSSTVDGIALNDGVTSVSITGNTSVSNTGGGIQVGINSTACDEIIISGNVSRLNTGVGYRESATSTNVQITGNNFRGNTAGDIIILSSSLQTSNALDSGWPAQTYTPTLTNTTNLDASTARLTQFFRIGNMVHVFGGFDADGTTGATQITMGMSLPIPSALTQTYQLAGTGASQNQTDNAHISIFADAANDRASLLWQTPSTANRAYTFHFSYQIL